MTGARNGWVAIHRGWMASPDFQPEAFTEREAFLWSIEQAAHAPHLQWFNKQQVAVGRGEFVTSIRKMAVAFQWGDKRVRGFTARMVRCGKWAQRGAHPNTVLTVCNYEQFQSPAKAKGTAKDILRAGSGQAQDTQQNNGNNGNNGNKGEGEASPPSRALVPALPYQDAVAAWTEAATVAGWKPRNPDLSDKRRTGLGKILKAHGLNGFVAALQRGLQSGLLCGPDPPPAWFNFSFVCNPENFLKLKDGNYDHAFTNDRTAKQSPWLAANAQLTGRGVHSPT